MLTWVGRLSFLLIEYDQGNILYGRILYIRAELKQRTIVRKLMWDYHLFWMIVGFFKPIALCTSLCVVLDTFQYGSYIVTVYNSCRLLTKLKALWGFAYLSVTVTTIVLHSILSPKYTKWEKIWSESEDICGKWLPPKYTKNTKYCVKFIDSPVDMW